MNKIENGHIILKAYRIYHDGLLNGDYEWDRYVINNSEVVYGKTVGEAKAQGLGLDDGSLGRPVEYTDIRTKRVKESDIVFFEGDEVKRWRMEHDLKTKERLHKMYSLPDDEMFYVQDARNYVGNAVLWWGLNSNGYVCDIHKAQKYTKDEIVKNFGDGRETDIIWPESHVKGAVKEIVDMQGLKREFSV